MIGKKNALKSDKPRNTTLNFRCNDQHKAQWKLDAKANGYNSTADYIIDLLNGDLQ